MFFGLCFLFTFLFLRTMHARENDVFHSTKMSLFVVALEDNREFKFRKARQVTKDSLKKLTHRTIEALVDAEGCLWFAQPSNFYFKEEDELVTIPYCVSWINHEKKSDENADLVTEPHRWSFLL